MAPTRSQTINTHSGEPRDLAIPAGVRNIPTPMTSPTTRAVAVRMPICRLSSVWVTRLDSPDSDDLRCAVICHSHSGTCLRRLDQKIKLARTRIVATYGSADGDHVTKSLAACANSGPPKILLLVSRTDAVVFIQP